MSEEGVDQKAEKLERSRKVGGGTAEGTTPRTSSTHGTWRPAKAGPPVFIKHLRLVCSS